MLRIWSVGFGFLFHSIHSPFLWQILKKTILFFGFKNPYKQSTKQEKSKVEGKKPVKNSSLRRLEFMPDEQKPRLKLSSIPPHDCEKYVCLLVLVWNKFTITVNSTPGKSC